MPKRVPRGNNLAKKNIAVYQSQRRLSIFLPTAAATARLGAALIKSPGSNIWLLSGPLGSGKTTLVRGALRAAGVTKRVVSPTFILAHDYQPRRYWNRVLHVDAYRIQRPSETLALDLNSAWADPKTLVLIEWPERLRLSWPHKVIKINMQHRRHGRVATVVG